MVAREAVGRHAYLLAARQRALLRQPIHNLLVVARRVEAEVLRQIRVGLALPLPRRRPLHLAEQVGVLVEDRGDQRESRLVLACEGRGAEVRCGCGCAKGSGSLGLGRAPRIAGTRWCTEYAWAIPSADCCVRSSRAPLKKTSFSSITASTFFRASPARRLRRPSSRASWAARSERSTCRGRRWRCESVKGERAEGARS